MLLLVRLEDLFENLTGHSDYISLVSVKDPLREGRPLNLIVCAIEVVLVSGDIHEALDDVFDVCVHEQADLLTELLALLFVVQNDREQLVREDVMLIQAVINTCLLDLRLLPVAQ